MHTHNHSDVICTMYHHNNFLLLGHNLVRLVFYLQPMMNREKVCDFEALLTEVCHPPVISDSGIDSWPARHWTLKYLAERLKSTQLQCKISSTDYEGIFS